MVITAQQVENVLRIYRRELQRSRLVNTGAAEGRPIPSGRATFPVETKPRLLMDRIKYQALEQVQYSAYRDSD